MPQSEQLLDMDAIRRTNVDRFLGQDSYMPLKSDNFTSKDMSRLEKENMAIDALIGKIETGELKFKEGIVIS